MSSSPLIPTFEELVASITQQFATLRILYRQWADLARCAIEGLPYDANKLAALETLINEERAALRTPILLASEHLTEEQLKQLRDQARMSKYAWRTLKKNRPITLKSGFWLVSY